MTPFFDALNARLIWLLLHYPLTMLGGLVAVNVGVLVVNVRQDRARRREAARRQAAAFRARFFKTGGA